MIPEGAIVASSALTNNKHAQDEPEMTVINYRPVKVIFRWGLNRQKYKISLQMQRFIVR
jgi:hypothetical protein